MKQRLRALRIAALLVWTCGCADGPTVPPNTEIHARLQAALDRAVSGKPMGGVLLVDIAGQLHFSGAAGVFDPTSGRRMRADDRFRIASVTKTMTSAVVLGLAEEGRLDLDGTLVPYFPAALLDRLHVMSRPGVAGPQSSGRLITIRQLLSHTSGLGDYFFDADEDRNGVADMVELIVRDPSRHWQPQELLEFAVAHTRPRFAPGAGYRYSDTNFVVLGLVVEALTGQPLHDVYRQRLFARLGMPGSYIQAYEPATSGPPADVLFDGNDVAPWMEIPGWGGGGVVSNTEELARFVRALFEGGVLRDASSLAQMQNWTVPSQGEYGLGLMLRFFPGAELRGHNGYWGSFMFYWPQRKAVICGTLNDSNADAPSLLAEAIRIVADEDLDGHVAIGAGR